MCKTGVWINSKNQKRYGIQDGRNKQEEITLIRYKPEQMTTVLLPLCSDHKLCYLFSATGETKSPGGEPTTQKGSNQNTIPVHFLLSEHHLLNNQLALTEGKGERSCTLLLKCVQMVVSRDCRKKKTQDLTPSLQKHPCSPASISST